MIKTAYLFLLFLTFSFLSQAQNWNQIGNPINGAALNDEFGRSISLSADGLIIAIGAEFNDANGEDSGHVRVFQTSNSTWNQIGNTIIGESSFDYSGFTIELNADGNIVAIGAPGNNENGIAAGQVRVYELLDNVWTQIGDDIDGENEADWSGKALSLSSDGQVVAIGAYKNDGNGTWSGQVRVYKNNANTWVQIGSDIDGEAAGDRAGRAVGLNYDGSIVAVGGYKNDANGVDAGHVRIYEDTGNIWTQIGDDIDGEAAEDWFGRSLSLSDDGTTVAISAINNDTNGDNAGQVSVYQFSMGNWEQLGNTINGYAAGDFFGYGVCLDSDASHLAIGAYGNDTSGLNAGEVKVYQYIGGNWSQIGDALNGLAPIDYFGESVSMNLDASVLAIGAPFHDATANNSGQVKVFTTDNLGITDVDLLQTSIFPNPTNGLFSVQSNIIGFKKIRITDVLGKEMLTLTSTQQHETIDISVYKSGIYYCYISSQAGSVVRKMLKE